MQVVIAERTGEIAPVEADENRRSSRMGSLPLNGVENGGNLQLHGWPLFLRELSGKMGYMKEMKSVMKWFTLEKQGSVKIRDQKRPEKKYGLLFDGDFDGRAFPEAVLGAVGHSGQFEFVAGRNDVEGYFGVVFLIAQRAGGESSLSHQGFSVPELDVGDVMIEIVGMAVFISHFDGNGELLAFFGGLGAVDEGRVTVDVIFFCFSLYSIDVYVTVDLGHFSSFFLICVKKYSIEIIQS